MTSASSGAVFFLGTRAHYQTLQGPGSAVDVENGNGCESGGADLADCSWIHCARSEHSGSDMLLLEYHCDEPPLGQNTGVTRRFRGRRSQDGLNARTASEATTDLESVSLHDFTYRDSIKSKDSTAGRCAPLRALLSNLRPRRRKPSVERESHQMCTYKDSCRCLDCQSRYFECDDSDSDCSMSSDYNDYFNYDYNSYEDNPTSVIVDQLDNQSVQFDNLSANQFDNRSTQQFDSSTSADTDDENDEVFIDSPPDNLSTDMLIEPVAVKEKMSISSEENDFENPLDLEMAAGTPIVLDYLLNHPITCSIQ